MEEGLDVDVCVFLQHYLLISFGSGTAILEGTYTIRAYIHTHMHTYIHKCTQLSVDLQMKRKNIIVKGGLILITLKL